MATSAAPLPSVGAHKCRVCSKTFSTSIALNGHGRLHAKGPPRKKIYECTFCGAAFARSDVLRSHLFSHTGEKPYKCQEQDCGVSFAQLAALHAHAVTHAVEKPFPCDECGRRFSRKFVLDEHKRTHEPPLERKKASVQCEYCKKGFTTKRSLCRHIRSHTGERPFKCSICERGFKESVELTRHVRKGSCTPVVKAESNQEEKLVEELPLEEELLPSAMDIKEEGTVIAPHLRPVQIRLTNFF